MVGWWSLYARHSPCRAIRIAGGGLKLTAGRAREFDFQSQDIAFESRNITPRRRSRDRSALPRLPSPLPQLQRPRFQDQPQLVGSAPELLEARDLVLAQEEAQALGQVGAHLGGVQVQVGRRLA